MYLLKVCQMSLFIKNVYYCKNNKINDVFNFYDFFLTVFKSITRRYVTLLLYLI